MKMKKIINIRDLEYEKLKLRVKQLELERQMSRTWKHIRNDLGFTLKSKQSNKPDIDIKTSNTLLNGAFNYGASFLSHKLGMIAGKRIESTAGMLLEKLAVRIGSLVSKKNRLQKTNKI